MKAHHGRRQGFTIVELLIVIVVIGILAAIVLVSFNGIQQRAEEVVLKSDLETAAKQLEVAKVETGDAIYPVNADALKASAGVEFEYSTTGSTFCLTARNNRIAFHITNSGPIEEGPCDGHVGPGGDEEEEVSFNTLTWTLREGAGNHEYGAVASSDDGMKLVVGSGEGGLYTSIDGGVSWTERSVPGDPSWAALAMSGNGQKIVGVVWWGYIYISNDGGANWIEDTSLGEVAWYDIDMSQDGSKIVAADYDAEFPIISTDGGATWSTPQYDNDYGYTSISCSDNCQVILAGTEGGALFTSTNGGTTWTQRDGAGNDGTGYWYGVAVSGDGSTMYAADNDTWHGPAYIYKSTNNGATWTALTEADSRRWHKIATSYDGTKIAVAPHYNYIVTSIDGGLTWTDQDDPLDYTYWSGVALSKNGARIIVANDYSEVYTGVYGP